MTMEVITKEDLNEFRKLLFDELKEFIQVKTQKQWLKSNEVRKLLNISPVLHLNHQRLYQLLKICDGP